MMKNKKAKVIVALSGGVDSSVAAALLKGADFNIECVFMRLWQKNTRPEKQAAKVAKKLGVPFRVLNFKKEFKKKIIDYFLQEYKIGTTPNPCVVCNKEIKFGLLMEKATRLGADFLATGHYARISNSRLFKAKDKEKDQSYFLWQLNKRQLKRVLFPLGGYRKKEVKEIAKKLGLPVFAVSESQEACFIEKSLNDFLARHIKLIPGDIFDCSLNFLGKHRGLPLYTIGQRKGIGLSGGPYWVLEKDLKRNRLIVTKNEKKLFQKEVKMKKINWIAGKPPISPLKVRAKIRYRHNSAPAVLLKDRLIFDRSQRAITAGQSVVFYKKEELIGGGQIY